MGTIDPVFAVAAALTAGAGLLVVTQRNPIRSAISMLACFLGLAVIYLRLEAPFLAAIHVLVYTGAILVLFLFVIMLLNLKPEELGVEYPLKVRGLIGAMCAALFGLIALPLWQDQRKFPELPAEELGGFGSVERVGHALFVDYALPFELISVLIMVAVFGGVLLAKKKL
ncbi:MAG: NADH-quinone oxidoreductase subunit J [Planctomycetes bacterium]|nr:NADH-quinone oxidoreductase subunit J [Planctomycetota bacterium]